MRKFNIGDKVIIKDPDFRFSCFNGEKGDVVYVESDTYDGLLVYEIAVKNNNGSDSFFWAKEDWIVLDPEYTKNQNSEMTDDEIYNMLKPKMQKTGIDFNGSMTAVTMRDYTTESIDYYMPIEDVKRLVATVYRSGYGRGQKGRPFIIGEKKKQGHWVYCEHGEVLAPGTKLRRNYVEFNDGDYAIPKIPVGTEVEVLDGYKDIHVNVSLSNIWVSFPGGNNGENEKAYKKFRDLTGYYVIHVGDCTEYFDKWVEE